MGARPRSRLAGYAHLLKAAKRLQWDEAALDLAADAPAFAALPERLRAPLRRLLAGFCVAEAAVAAHLAPFVVAAEDPQLARAFRAQAVDEARHARFFARAAREVAGIEDPRALAGPELVALFEDELPRRAAAVADGGDLAHAVGLYHLVLEGIVFLIGQRALLALLDAAGTLPALREGSGRVVEDERWHLGLGVMCLTRAGAADLDLDGPVALALRCWDVDYDAEHVLSGHLRRLRLGGADERALHAVADRCDVL